MAAARNAVSDDKRALELIDQIDAAVSSDLNTPQVLAVLQDALRDQDVTESGRRATLAACESLLGLQLDRVSPDDFEQRRSREDFTAQEIDEIDQLITARTAARSSRDWATADSIRDDLADRGVEVTDTPSGPTWAPRVDE
jgi:cysteinyl-tRNA synthetase